MCVLFSMFSFFYKFCCCFCIVLISLVDVLPQMVNYFIIYCSWKIYWNILGVRICLLEYVRFGGFRRFYYLITGRVW